MKTFKEFLTEAMMSATGAAFDKHFIRDFYTVGETTAEEARTFAFDENGELTSTGKYSGKVYPIKGLKPSDKDVDGLAPILVAFDDINAYVYKRKHEVEVIKTLIDNGGEKEERYVQVSKIRKNTSGPRTSIKAETYELLLVDAWNNPDSEGFVDKSLQADKFLGFRGMAIAMAANAKKEMGITTQIKHVGKGKGKLTDTYIQTGCKGMCATPKADVSTVDNKIRVSMKKAGGSTLMSASKNDAMGVFYAAQNAYMLDRKNQDKVIGIIESLLSSNLKGYSTDALSKDPAIQAYAAGTSLGTIGDLKKIREKLAAAAKAGKKDAKLSPEAEKELAAIEGADLNKGVLTAKLTKLFEGDTRFRQLFTFEAATGAGKFTDGVSDANRLLLFDETGEVQYYNIEKSESPKIVEMSNKVGYRLRWKHGTNIKLNADLTEEYEQFMAQELLNEGFGKSLLAGAKKFASNFKRVFIDKFLNWCKRLIRRGMNYLYSFLGIELSDIQIKDVQL